MRNSLMAGLGVVAASSMLIGCNGGTKAHTVSVALEGDLRGERGGPRQPLEVDVLAFNSTAENPQWVTMGVDEYFDIGNPVRRAETDRVTLYFDPTTTTSRLEVSANDPRWSGWKARSVNMLVLLIGGIPQMSGGGADARRLQLPLYDGAWTDERIEVRATRAGLRAVNGPQPKDE